MFRRTLNRKGGGLGGGGHSLSHSWSHTDLDGLEKKENTFFSHAHISVSYKMRISTLFTFGQSKYSDLRVF